MAADSGQVRFAGQKVWSCVKIVVLMTSVPFFHEIRSTVMMLLALIDPEGTRRRKMNKLIRRNYRSKVYSVRDYIETTSCF